MTKTGRFVRLACVALFAVTSVVVVGGPASADAVATIAELRAAVDLANADPGNDTIDLVSGATYSISGDQCDEVATKDDDENASGDLDVFSFNETADDVQDLTIEVPSGPPAIIQVSCPLTRAIEVVSPDDFSGLSADAVVQSGLVAQDAIGLGRLTLRNVVIRGGRGPHDFELFTVDSYGGGVFAFAANVTLDNVTFDDNAAADGLDGDDNTAEGGGGGFGGALAVLIGDIHIVDSTFNDNRAGHGGRGFDGFCDGDPVLPGAGGFGGSGGAIFALQVISSFELSIETSTFSSNHAGDGGDGGDESEAATCDEGPIEGGPGGFGGSGGAIAAFLSTLSVGHSVFVGNTAGDGGAGGSGSDGADALAPVLRPGAESPSAEFVAGDGQDAGSGAQGGDGGDGGAIATIGGTIVVVLDVAPTPTPTPDRVIVNSTFDSNVSGSGGPGGGGGNGGVGFGGGSEGAAGTAGDGGNGGFGGAVSDFAVSLDGPSGFAAASRSDVSPQQVEGAFELVHDTITQNGHGGAGGPAGAPGSGSGTPAAASDGESGGGSLDIESLEATGIVVGTSDGTGPDCWSEPLSAVSSFSTDDSCAFGPDSVHPFAAFGLTPLGDHGGPTATRAPLVGSILLNVIAPADCTVDDDQRLFVRPTGTGCEVGAVEVSPVTIAATKTAFAASVPAGSEISFKLTVTNTGTTTPKPGVAVADPNCGAPSLTEGDANSNGTLDAGETWTYTCTAKPTALGTFTNTVTFTVTDTEELTVSAAASATVEVTAVAADELARTGRNTGDLARLGATLIGIGALLSIRRPVGRHYRKRLPRNSRGRHFTAR